MAKALAFLLAVGVFAAGCSGTPDGPGAAWEDDPAVVERQVDLCEAPDLEGASLNNEDGAGGTLAISFAIINVSSSSCELVVSTASILIQTQEFRGRELRELRMRERGIFPLADLDTLLDAGERLLGRLEYAGQCADDSLSLEEVAVALVLGIGERFLVLTLPDIKSCTLLLAVPGAAPTNSPGTD